MGAPGISWLLVSESSTGGGGSGGWARGDLAEWWVGAGEQMSPLVSAVRAVQVTKVSSAGLGDSVLGWMTGGPWQPRAGS